MAQPEDRDLIARVARGDQAAFVVLVDRHVAAMIRYTWAVAEQGDDVEDVVQEAFLVAWRRRRELPLLDSLLPWLLVTCRNLARNQNRRRRRDRTEPLWEAATDDARRTAAEQLAWVQGELDALPALERRLIGLCLVEGRPYDEAARELGITPAAARKRVQRVRARLRAARDESEEAR